MKFIILFILKTFVSTEETQCILDINTQIQCTSEYIPVCGFSSDGSQLGTFENQCQACKIYNVIYYQSDPCVSATVYKINSQDGTTISKITIYSCDQLKYTFVDCEYPKDLSIPISTQYQYVKCTDPRPKICNSDYVDTCGLTIFPCYAEDCQKSFSNMCNACQDSKVIGYVAKSCSEYALTYVVAMPDTKNGSNIRMDNESEKPTIQKAVEYQCSTKRSKNCTEIINEVCANY